MYNRLILVAGSGRSGTSLLSGMLRALGCHVPQPEVKADDSNPKGFGEPQWVVDFHSKLLGMAGVETSDARPAAWAKAAEVGRERDVQTELERWLQREFTFGDHVVIKDPRLLWFIPLWIRAGETIATPCFVTMVRHPLEVIKSKQTHYGEMWHPNARTAGWLNTMLYTERATRENRRALVRYEDLLSDSTLTLSKVSDELELALTERASPPQMRAASRLSDPALKRSNATWESLGVDDAVVQVAEETWKTFDGAASAGKNDDPDLLAELDRLRRRYIDLYGFIESTAQFSIVAAAREGEAGTGRPSALSMRRLMRRVRRKSRRTLYRLRS